MIRTAKSSAAKGLAVLGMTASLLTAGATLAVSSASADSGCSQYNVAGSWNVTQSNIPKDAFTFSLIQTGQAVGGTASYTHEGNTTTGTVSGTVEGSAFAVDIAWSATSTGHYTATVSPTAMSNGYTYDVSNPDLNATWSATGTATCSTQTPTSKDQCKNGGWGSGTLVDANGNRFKNQGDCVSFVASGGKSDAHSA